MIRLMPTKYLRMTISIKKAGGCHLDGVSVAWGFHWNCVTVAGEMEGVNY